MKTGRGDGLLINHIRKVEIQLCRADNLHLLQIKVCDRCLNEKIIKVEGLTISGGVLDINTEVLRKCIGIYVQYTSGYSQTFYRSEEHTSELQSRGHLVYRL